MPKSISGYSQLTTILGTPTTARNRSVPSASRRVNTSRDTSAIGSKLKHEFTGDIVIPASFRIVRTLMEHDLVDQMRLKVFPVVLGAGERLFGETSGKKLMRLVDTRTLDGDTAYLTYERV
jgi:dihydrofolate reductase